MDGGPAGLAGPLCVRAGTPYSGDGTFFEWAFRFLPVYTGRPVGGPYVETDGLV